LTGKKNAFYVDGKNAVKFFFRRGADRLGEHQARIVDQNIQFAEIPDRFIEQPHNIWHARNIRLNGESIAADRLDFGHDFLRFGRVA
jgi:hypothetical protein